MIINIDSIDNMIRDLCIALDITPQILKETILNFSSECRDGICYDNVKFTKLAESFIKNNQKIHINEIYVGHLTRHIGEPKELLPLQRLLIGKNKFTHFLEQHGVCFSKKDNNISMYHNGREIDVKDLYDNKSVNNKHTRLARRLGYCGEADYCVNGYAFAIEPEKSMNDYYIRLMQAPELLQDLDKFLSTNICEEYKNKSKYYIAIFKVHLDDVIFDGMSSFNGIKKKNIEYIILCFMFLLDWYNNYIPLFNQIIRINDYKAVKVNYNILI